MQQDRVAIVTGASSGIGRATALHLAAAGWAVALAARRRDRLEELKRSIEDLGGVALVHPTDVTRRSDLERLIQSSLETFGRVDTLVNNAGIMPLSLLKNLHVDEWERMIDVNLKGALYGIAAVLPTFRAQGSGHIVNISSVAGRRVFPGGSVYCATKFGLNAVAEGLRQELTRSEGIRITSIEPGAVSTELGQSITDDEILEASGDFATMRMLEPDDVARAVVYAVEQPEHVVVAELLVLPREEMV